ECYRVGAERFGWAERSPEIASMRDGNWLVGYGMAGVTFGAGHLPCQARVSISRDGGAHVRSAATDIGTGTYTVATQLAAELLGLDIGQGASRSVTATCHPHRRPAAHCWRHRWPARSTMQPA